MKDPFKLTDVELEKVSAMIFFGYELVLDDYRITDKHSVAYDKKFEDPSIKYIVTPVGDNYIDMKGFTKLKDALKYLQENRLVN